MYSYRFPTNLPTKLTVAKKLDDGALFKVLILKDMPEIRIEQLLKYGADRWITRYFYKDTECLTLEGCIKEYENDQRNL